MKIYWKSLTAFIAVFFGASMFAVPAFATMGDDTPDKCFDTVIDKEAWTEPAVPEIPAIEEESYIVTHPAETKTIEHPAETKTVNHPAEYKDIHHEAKTHKEYFFAKYVRTKYKKNGKWGEYSDWTKYSPEQHTSWRLDTNPVGSPAFHGEGKDWYRQWQARWTGKEKVVVDKPAYTETVKVKDAYTETVVVKEAYTETVVVKEAWDEKIITQEYVPAVPGKDAVHHEATYKVVEVPCVVTPTEPTPEPSDPTTEPPKPTPEPSEPAEKDIPTENKDVLPATGLGANESLLRWGSAALLVGGAILFAVRRRAKLV